LVLSSDYEGFGLVIIEAMACGIPVVATNCPHGPSEIIEDGETGLLARLDVKDLAKWMEWMITHQEERRIMGAKAHEAVAFYRKDIIMKEWESAYKRV
jgi:glycosyltransferase involved in cell wall biosynthesis